MSNESSSRNSVLADELDDIGATLVRNYAHMPKDVPPGPPMTLIYRICKVRDELREPRSERGESALPFVVEYRRKPEHQYRGGWEWVPMAAFDVEGAAEGYVKSCSAGDPPWEYRVRPQPGERNDS